MATNEGGKRRKFQCLVIARFTAATVVAVLAFAGIVVVLTAGLCREDISLSVTHGHIQTDQVMWSKSDFLLNHTWRGRPEVLPIYQPAEYVALLLSIHAQNPTGRADTTCTITTVVIFDMPNAPSFTGMVRIAMLNVDYTFLVTGHSLHRWIPLQYHKLQERETLAYIARTYGGVSEFTAMLQVNMTISSGVGTPTNSTQYCWPVTIGHSRSTTAEAITCKPSHHINYAADAVPLAPPAASSSSSSSSDRLRW